MFQHSHLLVQPLIVCPAFKFPPNVPYDYSGYATPVPQYTQSQIAQYYAQYGCYPPQPYITIADYPTVPSQYPQTSTQQQTTYTAPSDPS